MAADVAEWLRRLTRNQIPSGSVGSNELPSAMFFFCDISHQRGRVKAQKGSNSPNKKVGLERQARPSMRLRVSCSTD